MLSRLDLVDGQHLVTMMCRSRFLRNNLHRRHFHNLERFRRLLRRRVLNRNLLLSHNRKHLRTNLNKGMLRCRIIITHTRLGLVGSMGHRMDLDMGCRSMERIQHILIHIRRADSNRRNRRCSSQDQTLVPPHPRQGRARMHHRVTPTHRDCTGMASEWASKCRVGTTIVRTTGNTARALV